MVVSHSQLVIRFITELEEQMLTALQLSPAYLRATTSYLLARAALARRDWKLVRQNLRNSWNASDNLLKLRLIILGICGLLRTDLFGLANRISTRMPLRGMLTL